MDIMCTLDDGSMVNIEMQNARPGDNFTNRMLYYLSCMCADSLDRGGKYNEMRNCYQIILTGFEMFNEGDYSYHENFMFRENRSNIVLSDAVQIHVLDLTKLPDTTSLSPAELEKLNDEEFYGILIKGSQDLRLLDKLRKTERFTEEMGMADKVMRTMTKEFEERIKALMLEKIERDTLSEIRCRTEQADQEGFDRGMQRGLEAGMQQGREAGLQQGIELGAAEANLKAAVKVVVEGGMDLEKSSGLFKIPLDDLKQEIEKYKVSKVE